MPTNPRTFPAIQFAIFSYLSVYSRFHSTCISSMAAVPENGTVDALPLNDNVKIGFQRPDIYSEKLSGTAIAYNRHVILCYKTHDSGRRELNRLTLIRCRRCLPEL
ncbi:hypothetical protein HanRHA438_Chr02g0052341 [Helianthus annuus]|nr:hypothetical protein HanHA300_Chr02g0041701 [Helianthus annuus]KAJ0613966.1 hypothetical protein HanIR_Chr02g0057181 [Helianthus annuus]KAJ0776249.1 hypothetical protein HanLR1_Chr02g0043421 [Helianthus annuus]KAJ0938669.1 hypothetical protein HanRHA438_Chr02g0052341 [Helianthus annuus]